MARNKSSRKRKPGKSGRTPSVTGIPHTRYPKRFLISAPPQSVFSDPAEFFYDTPEEAIRHCVRLGPQFFLDTQPYPPFVNIIRGFESSSDDAAIIKCLPADDFIVATELGMVPVSFEPWDKHTNNWADRPEEYDSGLCAPFYFTRNIPA
ncbi:TPA: hypothetical protein ACUNBO_003890 [Morganella morganii]